MQFQNAILTEEGVRILQSGTANNPVVFTRFLFTGSPTPLTAQTVNLPEPTWGNGHVTNYAAGQSGFVLYMMATNDTDYGYAYGYGVYGYLQNEGIENEKLLIVANYAGNVTYVSEASGSYTRFHLSITVSLSMSNSVLAIAPHYDGLVSDTAFQDLIERTVTTHSAADPQVGDDQTVRGHKEFVNGIGVWGSANGWGLEIDNYNDAQDNSIVRLRTTNGVYYANGIEFKHRDEEGGYVQNMMYVNSNIVPFNGASDLALGNRDHTFVAAYVRNIYTSSIYATQTIRVPTAELSTKLNTPLIEVVDGLNFYNTALEDDNIRLTWYGNELALKFQTGAVNAKVEFDVPVKFNSTTTISTLNISSATIGTISSGIIGVQQLEATALETGEAIVTGSVKTRGLELRGVLSPDNYPIAGVSTQPGELQTPIGSIRFVAIYGMNEGDSLPPGARLHGYTISDQCISRDAQTAELKFSDSPRQMESEGSNYLLLHAVKRDIGEISPLALVIKVRDDAS